MVEFWSAIGILFCALLVGVGLVFFRNLLNDYRDSEVVLARLGSTQTPEDIRSFRKNLRLIMAGTAVVILSGVCGIVRGLVAQW